MKNKTTDVNFSLCSYCALPIKSLTVRLETTHKPPKPSTKHPQTSQIIHKPPTNQRIISRKSAFYVTKNFSNNAKHVLSYITLH